MAPSSGGGGTSNDMPWRDKDEDFLHFARRTMLYVPMVRYLCRGWLGTSGYSFSSFSASRGKT
ncbi:MAG: hypothetical protein J6T44_06965, partial [Prevotella sp.]|nr:hypothetical protein [Prevotella sp.]